jgi:hypothetical protein
LPKPHECLSINIPVIEDASLTFDSPMPPIEVCPMNAHGLVDRYEKRVSPTRDVLLVRGLRARVPRHPIRAATCTTCSRGESPVTPLMYDLTRHDVIDTWKSVVG